MACSTWRGSSSTSVDNCGRRWVRSTLGAVDALTALATAWQPAASSEVFTLAAGNGYVYAGGSFGDLGGLRPRTNLAAIDLVSGDLLPWAPVANNPSIVSTVRSMEFVSGTLYLGGDFSGVNGTPRQGLVAVDATTGVVLSAWNPVVDGSVVAMLPMGSLLYVGGFFNTVSGTSRAHLAALDLATGALSSWDPGANSLVWALATDGTHVFAGGNFSVMGGLAHSCVASLDPVTGAVLPWTVAINGTFKFGGQFVPPVVYALAVQGNQLFLGGSFKSTNSWFCSAVADVNTGAVGTWFAPNFFEAGLTRVNAMHSRGTTLVVGGERVDLHSFNIPDGTVTAWAPTTLYAPVISVSGGQNMFVVGWLDGGITVYVDPVALETPFPRSAGPLALSPVVPNPVRTSGRVRFTLPSAGAVDLGLYDVSGRCVRMLLRGDVLPAGSHEVQVTTGALRPGIYLTRLHASGETRVSRMVIAR